VTPRSVADLMDMVAKKDADEGWMRFAVPASYLDYLTGAAAAARFGGRVFCNGDSVTIIEDKARFVLDTAPYAPYTAGELARAWLQTILEAHGSSRISHGNLVGGSRFGPALYFDPPKDRGGEWVMIDVKAAYWTLYSRHALDTMFRESAGAVTHLEGALTIPEADRAWVGAEKPLRNAAWGVMLGGRLSWYEGGVMRSKDPHSRYAAPGLTQLVLAQMNAIAAEARELGAVMWLTDAAICPAGAAGRVQEMLEDRWGLAVEWKASGKGYLYGLGDYQIGAVETAGEHVERGSHDGLIPLTQTARERLAAL